MTILASQLVQKKKEVMFQPAPNHPYTEPRITVNNVLLKTVHKFTYLGNTLSDNVIIDDEYNSRIAKASASFGKLRPKVVDRRGIHASTKVKIYQAVVLTTFTL